jgi:putative redox protein
MPNDERPMTAVHPTPLRTATLRWLGEMRFEGGAPDGPAIAVDGDGKAAPSPMVLLLLALGGCSGADVVSILKKMQVALTRCDITVSGERAVDHPRRYVSLHYRFALEGEGLNDAKARRAVELSIQKYCSVVHSLNPDIPVTWEVAV